VKYSWPEPEVRPFSAEQCREFRVRSEARRVGEGEGEREGKGEGEDENE
jgi:hypothetical protein